MNNNKKLLIELDEKFLDIFNNILKNSGIQESKESLVKMWDGLEQFLERDKAVLKPIFGKYLYEPYSKIIVVGRELTLHLPQNETDWRCLGRFGQFYFGHCINVENGIRTIPKDLYKIRNILELRNSTNDDKIRRNYNRLLKTRYCNWIIDKVEDYKIRWTEYIQLGNAFLERCDLCPLNTIERISMGLKG